jgi:hypothetical protein
MGTVTLKEMRKLDFSLKRIFGIKSWLGVDDAMKLGMEKFTHEIKHDYAHVGYLSATGIAYFRTIVSTIADADLYDGRVAYSDIWKVCKKVLAECLINKLTPDTAEEFLQLVGEVIKREIRDHTFVVSIYGIQLKGIECFDVGRFRLVPPTAEFVLANGISDKDGRLEKLMEKMGKDLVWFAGTVNATYDVAKNQFFHQARLTAGLLAISAASTFEQGAQVFRIGAVTSPEDARVPATIYLSWVAGDEYLGFGSQWKRGQDYEIDASLANQLTAAPVFTTMLRILQQPTHNDLEGAIVRAVYWFSDAQKDSSEVMRLVKFWSCIESFFSHEKDITKSISIGTSAVLTFGPFGFVSRSEYVKTRKRLVALYAKRSKAVHAGMHDHVDASDLKELSQWAAWLILSMAQMSDRYSESKSILAKCISLDGSAATS